MAAMSTTATGASGRDGRDGVNAADAASGATETTATVAAGGGADAHWLYQHLAGNQFFAAGFGLAVLATSLKTGQHVLTRAAHLARRRLLVEVEVTRADEAYPWLLRWISAQQRSKQTECRTGRSEGKIKQSKMSIVNWIIDKLTPGLRRLQIQTSRPTNVSSNATVGIIGGPASYGPSAPPTFSLVPGQGRHLIAVDGMLVSVDRIREKTIDLTSGSPFETVTLTTLYSHRHVFEHIFADAYALAEQSREGRTTIYTPFGTEWRVFGEPKRKRAFQSVVLAQGLADKLLTDVKAFLAAEKWYLDRGIPYHRGYLLHGPPGTGKSSFVQALAGELDFDIAVLNLSARGLTDDRLNVLLTNVPGRCVVLLEDADAAFINRTVADQHGYSGATVTFSGLLNALDGVGSAEERVLVMTTNHVDRLDPALLRPGRVDVSVQLGLASETQISHLWDRFYDPDPDDSINHKTMFMQSVMALGLVDNVSTAELQGLFLYHKGDPQGAIRDLPTLIRDSGSTRV